MTDLLWITATLFAAVYSSFEEGDTPKFQLISTPVSQNFCTGHIDYTATCTLSRLWTQKILGIFNQCSPHNN